MKRLLEKTELDSPNSNNSIHPYGRRRKRRIGSDKCCSAFIESVKLLFSASQPNDCYRFNKICYLIKMLTLILV